MSETPREWTNEPRWLDDEEMAAWLPLIQLVNLLPQELDRQLREEAGISHGYYSMLAILSDQPNRTLSMGELARLTWSSPSRLTNAVSVLEKHGWVRRETCPDNRRKQLATLTDEGFDVLKRIAPSHVAEVRRRVFDRLSRDEIRQLRKLGEKLVEGLEG